MKKDLIASLVCAVGVALAMPVAASAASFSGAAASTQGGTGLVELAGRRDHHHGRSHKRKLIDIHIGKKRHGHHRRNRHH